MSVKTDVLKSVLNLSRRRFIQTSAAGAVAADVRCRSKKSNSRVAYSGGLNSCRS